MEHKSGRSYKSLGIAAIGVGAISVASVMAPPADVEVPEHKPASTASSNRAMVELLASIQRMTTHAETPLAPAGSASVAATPGTGTSAAKVLAPPPIPVLDAMAPPLPVPAPILPAPAGSTREATSGSDALTPEVLALPANPLLGGLADLIDNSYNAVEPSVRFLVEAVEDGLTLLGVPVFLAAQGTILYTFGEAVVKSVLFNATDWLRGEGSFFSNLEDLGNDLLAAGLWLVIDELNAFNLLPPTPVDLPRPPINQSVGLDTTTSLAVDEDVAENVTAEGSATDLGTGSDALPDEIDAGSSATVDSGSSDISEPVAAAQNSVDETLTEGDLSGELDPGNTVGDTSEPTGTDPAGTDDISAENVDEAADDEPSRDTNSGKDASTQGDSDPAQDADEADKRDKDDHKSDKNDKNDKNESAKADNDRGDSGENSD